MNILVIGSGGREHAVLRAFSESASSPKLYCSSNNAGHQQIATYLPMDLKSHASVVNVCLQNKIEFVFIGPEDPLVDGLSDTLRENQICVFGPSKESAQLEGSKIFAKKFMQDAHVPTAHSVVVDSVEKTLAEANGFTAPYVLKADGLAAGKGVFICADLPELKLAAEKLFVQKIFGKAGSVALLEQNLKGYELSFLVLTNGSDFQALPIAQDHKRLLDGDKGPNTGGMGTIAPLHIENKLYDCIIESIVKPSILELKKRNYTFRGVLFIGLMVVNDKPSILEYNVRFGDPETQVILPLVKNDLVELFYKISCGELPMVNINHHAACCVVNAAENYPDNPTTEVSITLPNNKNDQYILHAGTKLSNAGQLQSNGGRVLNIVSVATDLHEALKKAYKLNNEVIFNGRQFRQDIGLNYQSQRKEI